MAAILFFDIAGSILLAILAYVFWSGVGAKRRDLGRFLGVIFGGMAAYLAWEAIGYLKYLF